MVVDYFARPDCCGEALLGGKDPVTSAVTTNRPHQSPTGGYTDIPTTDASAIPEPIAGMRYHITAARHVYYIYTASQKRIYGC